MQTQTIQDINSKGIASAYVNAPFDEGKEELERNGYRLISLEENARLRLQEGKSSYVYNYGNRTREGVLYVPNKGIFLTKNSPITANPKAAVNCSLNRGQRDFYLTDEQVEEALRDSVKLEGNLITDFYHGDRISIPTKRLGDDKIAVYAFGDFAKQYGELLRKAKIKEMSIFLAKIKDKPFVRQVWFMGLKGGMGFSGCNEYLYQYEVGGKTRGICENNDYTLKNSEADISNQVYRGVRESGFSGLVKTLMETIRGRK